MKFNDGFWLLRSGVKASYGVQVVDSKLTDSDVTLAVATKPIRARGDTLGGP